MRGICLYMSDWKFDFFLISIDEIRSSVTFNENVVIVDMSKYASMTVTSSLKVTESRYRHRNAKQTARILSNQLIEISSSVHLWINSRERIRSSGNIGWSSPILPRINWSSEWGTRSLYVYRLSILVIGEIAWLYDIDIRWFNPNALGWSAHWHNNGNFFDVTV